MQLDKLNLFNFRNYADARLQFGKGVHCLLGSNGSGKTNLLDAIYYLSFTKSSLSASDTQNIREGELVFSIKGVFSKNDSNNELVCSFQTGQKKTMREDNTEYPKLSEHIGKYPVVLVAPNDIELIWDGGEVRRKFFDSLISQIDKPYLENLISYNAHLKMRNSMLRHFAEKGKVDHDLLASCEHKLIPSGDHIAATRKTFVRNFSPVFERHYRLLSGEVGESVAIQYQTDLDDSSFEDILKKNLARDLALQRTSGGVHRDDFRFLLNGFDLKRYGSQGQQKSFLIGLKLAEFDIIRVQKGFKPILLLDDIFDKLDDQRIQQLMKLVVNDTFGQIFITDARPGRSLDVLKMAGIGSRNFRVEGGNLKSI